MLAMLLYALILGGLLVLLAAGVSALREGFRRKARLRGFLIAIGVILLALTGFWVMLI